VPRVVGLTEAARGAKRTPSGPRRQWTEEQFFTELAGNVEPDAYRAARDLYAWSKETADDVPFGTGRERGSFTFHYVKDNRKVSVSSVFTGGNMTINYGWLSSQIDLRIIDAFHQRLVEIPTFKHTLADLGRWPSIKLNDAFPRT
jgi:hypothetical protein